VVVVVVRAQLHRAVLAVLEQQVKEILAAEDQPMPEAVAVELDHEDLPVLTLLAAMAVMVLPTILVAH
jgi:hypothetical protein